MRARKRTDRYAISRSPLFGIRGTGELADALGVTTAELAELRLAARRYREWEEPKASGGVRLIENPPKELKRVQGRIARLLMRIVPPDFLFCPVAKRGAIENAQEHFGAKQVWSIDIKDYFPSTQREGVFQFFKLQLRCAGDIAGYLTDLVCRNGRLPQGAPTSPIMAYFANQAAWSEIHRYCQEADCRMTLWIDDLTVSGEKVSRKLRWQVKSALRRAKLHYHKEKFGHLLGVTLTGVVVAERRFELPFKYFRDLRRLRRAIRKAAPEARSALRESLKGKLAYGRLVRNAYAQMV